MEEQSVFSNCPISQPIFYPDYQIKSFNGLAWSNTLGMIHQVQATIQTPPETWIAD